MKNLMITLRRIDPELPETLPISGELSRDQKKLFELVERLKSISNPTIRGMILSYSDSYSNAESAIRILHRRTDIYSRGSFRRDLLNRIIQYPKVAESIIDMNPKIKSDVLYLAISLHEVYRSSKELEYRIPFYTFDDVFGFWSEILGKRVNPLVFLADAIGKVADGMFIDQQTLSSITSYANEYDGISYKYNNRFLVQETSFFRYLDDPSRWIEDRREHLGRIYGTDLYIEEISDPMKIVMLQHLLAASSTCLRYDGDPIRRLQLFGTAIDPNTKILALTSPEYKKPISRLIVRLAQGAGGEIMLLPNEVYYTSEYDILDRKEGERKMKSSIWGFYMEYLDRRAKDLKIRNGKYSYMARDEIVRSGTVIGFSYYE
ncbi:MAG: hypothetical protein NZ908_02345 [Candidatus Micrarchaeota archaeon]|nr:hypothetical protein [Candidatus Micrarchaeota archaeon]MCX8154340.1 hypothetical protein [Candidatus Micrarchaeota archaeon]